jgi:hypothetical protein
MATTKTLKTLTVLLGAWVLAGCEGAEMRSVQARILANAADECVYDVRDRGLTYETSRNCSSLSGLASQYIAVGGFKDLGVPKNPSHAQLAQSARTSAWMARALSNTKPGSRGVAIW